VVAAGTPAQLAGPGPELTFAARPGLPLASLGPRLAAGLVAREPVSGRYVVLALESGAGVDTETLREVSGWCAEQGVVPERLALAPRSLEDVFLELTGRSLQ
jgi:ABC-2 type transport system ATP-binding protein